MNLTELLGTIAGICTTIAFLPQVVKTIRTRHTDDLAMGTQVLTTVGIALWLVYGILMDNFPIIAANAISVVLSGMILVMKLWNEWKKTKS